MGMGLQNSHLVILVIWYSMIPEKKSQHRCTAKILKESLDRPYLRHQEPTTAEASDQQELLRHQCHQKLSNRDGQNRPSLMMLGMGPPISLMRLLLCQMNKTIREKKSSNRNGQNRTSLMMLGMGPPISLMRLLACQMNKELRHLVTRKQLLPHSKKQKRTRMNC